MKYKFILFFLFIAISSLACEKEDPDVPLVLPSELNLEVQQSEENAGKIILNLSATDANYYLVYFGENEAENPLNTKENKVEYTYSSSGTYTIKVQAHATATAFITETIELNIALDDGENGSGGEDAGEGYATPETYEGMQLVWRDEFEGSQLNQEDWTFETGTGSDGWGNAELQYYREENTSVQDGYLKITAKEEAHGGRNYTSSRIKTQDKQSFQYGRIDIRAKLPQGQGIWPALWMLGSNFSTAGWPACGEIDIMEMIGGEGRDNTVHGTIHWQHAGDYASYGNGYTLDEGILADQFHVYSIVWDESSITWYIDDIQFNVVDISPAEMSEFHQEFFLIFNVAVGGRWPGSPDDNTSFPQSMLVDYVRVFQVD